MGVIVKSLIISMMIINSVQANFVVDFISKLELKKQIFNFLESKEHRELKNVVTQLSKAVVLIHTFNDTAKDDSLIYHSALIPRSTPLKYTHGVISGTIVHPSGIIVTTYDGVKNSTKFIISLNSEFHQNSADSKMIITEDDYEANIVREIPELGLTILKILPKNKTTKFPYIELGSINKFKKSSNEMILNKSAFALGKALGKNFVTYNKPTNSENSFSFIASPIECVKYEVIDGIEYLVLENKILGSCLSPENSGGAVIDSSGKLIGVADYKIDASIKLKYTAIPVNIVSKAIKIAIPQIFEKSEFEPFGATFLDNEKGIYVQTLIKDSIADKAGLKQSDIVIKFNGNVVNKASTLQNLIERAIGDGSIILTIVRNNKDILEIEFFR